MNTKLVQDLVLQSLEHERGGVKIYATAILCALDSRLKGEWEKYHAETTTHVQKLEGVCRAMGLDPETETPGRAVVRYTGNALVQTMKLALADAEPAAAEIVACECVVLAETKDHLDWELLTKCAERLEGPGAEALSKACAEIEDQEDEHLYHTKGWCRELWIQALGLPPVLPPPEERRHVRTAIGAANAEQAAERLR